MSNINQSRAVAIDAQCKGCIYDDRSAGTWREQVAACVSSNCALHTHRPLPPSLRIGGEIDRPALAALRDRLERMNNQPRQKAQP